mmetsp:Transcript_15894/g.39362  ORF Transcript_15894/g.39362 Transcript_15894/m.39362 type:complete len:128 (-) Transcript_15894:108-491(-)
MTSERDQLLRVSTTENTGAQPPSTSYETVVDSQWKEFRSQEEQLGALSVDVSSIKRIAGVIQGEVSSQNDALDELEGQMDQRTRRIEQQRLRAGQPVESPYSIGTFCSLLWPLVLLVLVMLWAIGIL